MDAKNISCYLPTLAIEIIAKNKYGLTKVKPDETLFQKFYVNYLHDDFGCKERFPIKPNCLTLKECDNPIFNNPDCDYTVVVSYGTWCIDSIICNNPTDPLLTEYCRNKATSLIGYSLAKKL